MYYTRVRALQQLKNLREEVNNARPVATSPDFQFGALGSFQNQERRCRSAKPWKRIQAEGFTVLGLESHLASLGAPLRCKQHSNRIVGNFLTRQFSSQIALLSKTPCSVAAVGE